MSSSGQSDKKEKQKQKEVVAEVEKEHAERSKKPVLGATEFKKEKGLFQSLKAELDRLKQEQTGASSPDSRDDSILKKKQKEVQQKIDNLIQKFEAESTLIIFDIFPSKIERLDALFRQGKNFNASLEDLRQSIDVPEPTPQAGAVSPAARFNIPCNKVIVELENSIKHEILEMTEYMNTLSIWIQLNVPRIQDGNNFGVEVQSEIISVLESTGSSGFDVLGGFTEYHLARGALISKLLKYPGVEDFHRAILELDERSYTKTALVVLDLRNSYLLLFDLISKNYTRIEEPRTKDPPPFMY